jgi:hypothetical protein
MQARLLGFGRLEIEGEVYERDVVIDGGKIRKRRKGPSKPLRDHYGHTPLTAAEDLPWGGHRLIVGTGAMGSLPIDPDVSEEARRRRVELVAMPTAEACELLADVDSSEVFAVLHTTC